MKQVLAIAQKAQDRIFSSFGQNDRVKPPLPTGYDVLPEEFSSEEYLLINPDVAEAGMDAATHFRLHGAKEGRSFRLDMTIRHGLALTAAKDTPALEIGPFCNPILKGEGVFYFDIMDRESLIERATKIGYPNTYAPHIDYVSDVGDLRIIDRTFVSVASAHCIEHHPDLIAHLKDVGSILRPGGKYFLIIPDKRYCFDALFHESELADVLAAHLEKRRLHTARNYLDHYLLATHNDPVRHWAGDHKNADYDSNLSERARRALDTWPSVEGSYFDVHAWRFTPESFKSLMQALKELNLIDLEVEAVNETPRNTFEFTAILRKPHNKASSSNSE